MNLSDLSLHPLLLRNLTAMGFRRPRPIQEQAIAPLLEGRDLIGLAPTGTGKTAAFIAPLAHHLLEHKPPTGQVHAMQRLRALVLCPTRELAVQVAEEAARICQGTVLRIACAYGKVSLRKQADRIASGVDILVATTGRVRELLEADQLSLAYIRHVVIDEGDRMLDMGFLPQVEAILRAMPHGHHTALFTATMPRPIEELARRFLRDPVRIEVGRHTTPATHVRQHLVPAGDRDKVPLLLHLLAHGRNRGVLVFCRTRRRVGWVGGALQRHSVKLGMIHGDRTQAQRSKALERFAAGELDVLVASDVAARGLHIPAVRTVINYDLPPNAEEYVHRIGRAGHGGGFGEALTFVSPRDQGAWENIASRLDLSLNAEVPKGFEPSGPARPKEHVVVERETVTRQPAPQKKRKRSKKGRPIEKGQQPGKGVRRRSE
jgi:ATP-dependent RNA helicase RhlE